MDLFILESKAKKYITDQVEPIVEQIESEREERARVEVKHDKIAKRLLRLERLMGCDEASEKPRSVEIVENKLADLKTKFLSATTEIRGSLEGSAMERESIIETQRLIQAQMASMQNVSDRVDD